MLNIFVFFLLNYLKTLKIKMKQNDNNIIKIYDLSSPFNSKRNNLMYKNYIFNLFQYNENKRKKKVKQIYDDNFKAIIKSRDTPIRNNSKKCALLNTYTNENYTISNITPIDLKKINKKIHNHTHIPKNFFKSRNNLKYDNLINSNYSSLNRLLTISGVNNTTTNSKEKYLFLRPISKQRYKTEILRGNRNNNQKDILMKDKNIKKRLPSANYQIKLNILNEKKNNNNISRPKSNKKDNNAKELLYKDINDMHPRNRFNMLRKELMQENIKINKMFIKFQKQISKNHFLINRFKMIKSKGNS